MLSVGVDIIEIGRIAAARVRFGERFTEHIYTEAEIRYCNGRIPELAARFAAKEAVSKALGTGMVGLSWREIEILADARGKPYINLYGRARDRASALGLADWSVSLSHSRDFAVALVVASGEA